MKLTVEAIEALKVKFGIPEDFTEDDDIQIRTSDSEEANLDEKTNLEIKAAKRASKLSTRGKIVNATATAIASPFILLGAAVGLLGFGFLDRVKSGENLALLKKKEEDGAYLSLKNQIELNSGEIRIPLTGASIATVNFGNRPIKSFTAVEIAIAGDQLIKRIGKIENPEKRRKHFDWLRTNIVSLISEYDSNAHSRNRYLRDSSLAKDNVLKTLYNSICDKYEDLAFHARYEPNWDPIKEAISARESNERKQSASATTSKEPSNSTERASNLRRPNSEELSLLTPESSVLASAPLLVEGYTEGQLSNSGIPIARPVTTEDNLSAFMPNSRRGGIAVATPVSNSELTRGTSRPTPQQEVTDAVVIDSKPQRKMRR